MTGVIPLMII